MNDLPAVECPMCGAMVEHEQGAEELNCPECGEFILVSGTGPEAK